MYWIGVDNSHKEKMEDLNALMKSLNIFQQAARSLRTPEEESNVFKTALLKESSRIRKLE